MAAVRGFFQTGMAMKPAKTFFLLDLPLCIKIFYSTLSSSRLLVCLRARTITPGDHHRGVTQYFPNIRLLKISFRPSGLQALDCVMKRFDGIREIKR
jgi:hypothetical protein